MGALSQGANHRYRLARWIADRNPTGRVFAFGGLCFRLNSWFNIPQVEAGVFESGLRKPAVRSTSLLGSSRHGQPAGRPWKGLGAHDAAQGHRGRLPGGTWTEVEGVLSRLSQEPGEVRWPARKASYREDDDVIYQFQSAPAPTWFGPKRVAAGAPPWTRSHCSPPHVAAIDDAGRPKLRTQRRMRA